MASRKKPHLPGMAPSVAPPPMGPEAQARAQDLAASFGGGIGQVNKAAGGVDGQSQQDLENRLPPPPARGPGMSEVGWSGLNMYGGWVDEEWHQDLKGNRYIAKFREMADEDPTVGAILANIEQLMRQVEWSVEPADGYEDDDEALAYRDFFAGAFNDLSASFNDTRSAILRTMLTYGWQFSEIVYKRRVGPYESNGRRRSKYTDRLIGWRKFAGRSAETLWRWEVDEKDGSLNGMWQYRYVGGEPVLIPIEKGLLFRTTVEKDNPQGRSLLRSAYRPYRYRKRLETIEGIGIERDLAGLPVAWVPPDILSDDATSGEKQILAAIKTIVTQTRRNEQEGIVFPLMHDEKGNKRYDLTLLSTGGTRQIDIGGAIDRKALEIAQAMLFDFLMMGHEKAGSWALGTSKIDQSLAALDAWLDDMAEVFTQHAMVRLGNINGFDAAKLPRLSHSSLENVDLGALGEFLKSATAAGAVMFPDPGLESYLREVAGLPPAPDEVVESASELAEIEAEARIAQAKNKRDNPGGPMAAADAMGGKDGNPDAGEPGADPVPPGNKKD